MPDIDTIRPNGGAATLGTWPLTGGASIQAVTSDDSDATYVRSPASGNDGILTVQFPTHTPAAGFQRHQVRQRVRARQDSDIGAGFVVATSQLRGNANQAINTQNLSVTANPVNLSSPYSQSTHAQLGNVGAIDFSMIIAYDGAVMSTDELRVLELYIDIDCRAEPTFVGDIVDGAGVSRDGGIVTDTNAPYITFGSLNYDGLPAREWEINVKNSGGASIQFITGSGQPPTSRQLAPLANGDYTADLRIWSTVRTNSEFPSDIVTVAWEQDFITPAAPVLTVDEGGCGLTNPNVEVCWVEGTPTATVFDSEPVIEIVRVDGNGNHTAFVDVEAYDGCFCDRFACINDPGFYCGDQAEQGLRFINTGSARAQTVDAAPIDITGDIEMEWDGAYTDWLTFTQSLARKSGSWVLSVGNWEEGEPSIIFGWDTGGPTFSVRSTRPIDFDPAQRVKIKVTHDVNDGAGSRLTTFYVDRGNGYEQWGDPITAGVAGSLTNSASALVLGSSNFDNPDTVGYIYGFTLRNGIGGTVVANPDFSDPGEWTIGEDVGDSAVDSAGRTWTISGDAGASIQEEACLVFYRARYWGLVEGIVVASDWAFSTAVMVTNPTPGNSWVHGVTEGDLSVCEAANYGTFRPFGVFQAVEGGIPTVITGDPSGRNYNLAFQLDTEADLVALEDVLAQALFFYQHPSAADLWLAPNQTSVEVTKILQRRILSVDTIAVNPQPFVDPATLP
jgi:hypothetical protein